MDDSAERASISGSSREEKQSAGARDDTRFNPASGRQGGHLVNLVLLAVLLVVGGWCFHMYKANQERMQRSKGINPAMEEEGKSYISTLLRDPESAQFRNVKSMHTCITGEVNGKNGFGGYAGFVEFFYDGIAKTGQMKPAPSAEPGPSAKADNFIASADFNAASAKCTDAAIESQVN